MNIQSLFKSAFNGQTTNNSLKLKDSVILNLILSLISAIALIISIKIAGDNILDTDALSTLFPRAFAFSSFLGVNSIVEQMIAKIISTIFLTSLFTHICLLFITPGIIYLTLKYIFNKNVSYEQCLSIFSFASIVPTIIYSASLLLFLISALLGYTIIICNIILLLLLTYEGFSPLLQGKSSKLTFSLSVSYMVSVLISGYINYSILVSAIEHKLNSLF